MASTKCITAAVNTSKLIQMWIIQLNTVRVENIGLIKNPQLATRQVKISNLLKLKYNLQKNVLMEDGTSKATLSQINKKGRPIGCPCRNVAGSSR